MTSIGEIKGLAAVEMVISDVDGVLTNGQLLLGPNGEEIKGFNVKDGLGIRLLLRNNIRVALISARKSKALQERARELDIPHLLLGQDDKSVAVSMLMASLGIPRHKTLAIGDDLPDLGLFECVGIKVAVFDAAKELKERADVILESKGGEGALREVSEAILKAKGLWEATVKGFLPK